MARNKSRETTTKKPATPRKTATTRRGGTRAVGGLATKSAASAPAGLHSEAQIRERAYFIYLERSGVPGDAVSDWFQAERELNRARKGVRA